MARVVAVLGRGVVPADQPVLRADDLGVLRGDGIFETMHVRAGVPWLLDEHLARMARSAARLDLSLPAAAELTDLVTQACAGWPAAAEGALRLVATRGSEDGGPVTVFATVTGVSPTAVRQRAAGVRLVTASLGYPADVRARSPWLLGGVKALSYAVNMATTRWAAAEGYDDALWVSADGYALEAPTATLVWRAGTTLCTVPASTGVLPGTTAAHLFASAGELGWRTAERMVEPAELSGVDGVWLVSSVRGIAPVRALDGTDLPPSPDTARLRTLLGYPLQAGG